MANYNFENIDYITDQMIKLYALDDKRITEQMMEFDVLADIEQIRTEEISYINDAKYDAISYIAEHKRDLIKAFSEYDGFRAALQQIILDIDATSSDAVDVIESVLNKIIPEINATSSDTTSVIEDISNEAISYINETNSDTVGVIENIKYGTEEEIKEDMMTIIANNGYELNVSDDGDGNIVIGIVKEAI